MLCRIHSSIREYKTLLNQTRSDESDKLLREHKVTCEGYTKIVNENLHNLEDAQVLLEVEKISCRSSTVRSRVETAQVRLSFAQKELELKKKR